ncbi:MAG: MopE-related protein [Myxococcota bacterium]
MLLALLNACLISTDVYEKRREELTDGDGDGVAEVDGDCNDRDPDVYQGAPELCDGEDQDCDGVIDGDPVDGAYVDTDGDGHGGGARSCDGTVASGDDCDDGNAAVHPGALETCDGADEDCDSQIDEEPTDAAVWYPDADADGYGDDAGATASCDQLEGYVESGGDCDDDDASFNPAAQDVCTDPEDYNCDGSTEYADVDGDGWAACEDCDDADAGANPEAIEACNGADDDCDGETDEAGATGEATWFADADGDGYGDAASSETACAAPDGYVADSTDCDDDASEVNPGEFVESCATSFDDDCDGATNEEGASACTVWYEDADGDGSGGGAGRCLCDADGAFTETMATDCDDTEAGVNPDATETCATAADDDCDGSSNEVGAASCTSWFKDDDGDGYGSSYSVCQCAAGSGYTASNDDDCDDARSSVSPSADETCATSFDDDCDGYDNDVDALGCVNWYVDADADGYGTGGPECACDAEGSWSATNADDCDDSRAGANPSETETCTTSFDDDCDGDPNELDASGCSDWYADADGDGYGSGAGTCFCSATASLTAPEGDDCDDADASASPGLAEVCGDGIDNDCDGTPNACEMTGDVTLSTAASRILGDFADAHVGQEYMLAAGDMTGDGLTDVVVGHNPLYGTVTAVIVSNPTSGDHLVSTAVLTVSGSGEPAGGVQVWDLDGDGVGDLLHDNRTVEVFLGPITAAVSVADAEFFAPTAGTLTGLGDQDGDGFDDVVVSAESDDVAGTDAGAVYLFTGALTGYHDTSDAHATLLGEDAGDYAGRSVASLHDVNGDGVDDLAVGAYGDDDGGTGAGAAYVLLGPVSGTVDLVDADAKFSGSSVSEEAAYALTSAGDFDGDGSPDLLVGGMSGDLGGSGSGQAYLVTECLSSAPLADSTTILVGSERENAATYLPNGSGDVNGDGFDDVLVGGGTDSRGTAYLVYGGATGTISLSSADASFSGDATNDQAGRAMLVAPDLDVDGFDEVVIGVRFEDDGYYDAGAVYVFAGGGL